MQNMLKKDFDYDLPKELIAQEPCCPRDAARLLCLTRENTEMRHDVFKNLPDLLNAGDLLVVNNSKVLPARLIGHKEPTGAVCELLLLRQIQESVWECLAKPGKRLHIGNTITFGDGTLQAEILSTAEDGNKTVRFTYNTKTLYEKLDEFGKMPLPPYIQTQLDDNTQYQTVYAKEIGSAAAPTAGLHFTEELFARLHKKGIRTAEITLHVGLGTFRPVKCDVIEEHHMHEEYYEVPEETAKAVKRTRERGGRVIAVGTTSVRTLESNAKLHDGVVTPYTGVTDIFIYPGYQWEVVDALITNFHLPESTLLMLVSAFYNREAVMHAYQTAIDWKYRFFSFGDALFIE